MARYHGEMVEAKAPEKRRAKVLHEISVKRAENGGHVVTHRFDNSGPGVGYHEPEDHVFGSTEGGKLLQHITEHMGLGEEAAEALEEKTEEKVAPGIHKKVAKEIQREAKGAK